MKYLFDILNLNDDMVEYKMRKKILGVFIKEDEEAKDVSPISNDLS